MQTWLPHLIEFRKRALLTVSVFFLCFVAFFYCSKTLFSWIAAPLLSYIPGKLLAINVASPLLVPLQLSANAAIAITIPFALYQLWQFITPALYPGEKSVLPRLILASIVLFYAGMAFCYYLVLPLLFTFFIATTPSFVHFSPDIGYYLNFCMSMMISFGCCFQVPVIIVFLLKANIVSEQKVRAFRPYLIVLAFTIGMLLTPPDVLSQVLLAIPICLLYEVGLFLGKK